MASASTAVGLPVLDEKAARFCNSSIEYFKAVVTNGNPDDFDPREPMDPKELEDILLNTGAVTQAETLHDAGPVPITDPTMEKNTREIDALLR